MMLDYFKNSPRFTPNTRNRSEEYKTYDLPLARVIEGITAADLDFCGNSDLADGYFGLYQGKFTR